MNDVFEKLKFELKKEILEELNKGKHNDYPIWKEIRNLISEKLDFELILQHRIATSISCILRAKYGVRTSAELDTCNRKDVVADAEIIISLLKDKKGL